MDIFLNLLSTVTLRDILDVFSKWFSKLNSRQFTRFFCLSCKYENVNIHFSITRKKKKTIHTVACLLTCSFSYQWYEYLEINTVPYLLSLAHSQWSILVVATNWTFYHTSLIRKQNSRLWDWICIHLSEVKVHLEGKFI